MAKETKMTEGDAASDAKLEGGKANFSGFEKEVISDSEKIQGGEEASCGEKIPGSEETGDGEKTSCGEEAGGGEKAEARKAGDGEEKAGENGAKEAENSEAAELKESYLRLAAEYENYRKRSLRERERAFSDAKASVFTELLPVLDNFERALAAEASDGEFRKGVEMTYRQLLELLGKFDVEPFGEPGETFDPQLHNAVMHVEDAELSENVVAEVFQKGYRAGDRILRPAVVKVAN